MPDRDNSRGRSSSPPSPAADSAGDRAARPDKRAAPLGSPVYWVSAGIFVMLFWAWGFATGGGKHLLAGYNDFAPVYAATQLVGTPGLYDKNAVYDVITEQFGRYSPAWRYTRMPFHAVALWPIGLLPYQQAYLIFLLLQAAAVAVFLSLWRLPRQSYLNAFAMLSFPLTFAMWSGQDAVFLLAWIALAVHQHRQARAFRAGVFLSLCLIKFHLFLFLPLLLLAQRRYRMFAGAAAGSVVLVAVSFAAGGLSWPLEYFDTLTDPVINFVPFAMVNIHGLLFGLPGALFLEVIAAVAIAAVIWRASRRGGFEESLALVLLGGLARSYHTYVSDSVLLLPAASIVIAYRLTRWTAVVCWLLVTPFLFVLLVFGGVAYPVQLLIVVLLVVVALDILGPGRGSEPASART